MHTYEKLKEMLCDELEEITKKGELTAGSLDTVDKLTHAIKSIETIMAMNEYDSDYSYEHDGHMSNARGYRNSRPYRDGGMSYARGRGRNAKRDSMGRYSNGGYSYDDAKADMIDEIKEIMQDAPDEQTKKEFQRFVNKLESM